jgi:putative tryptophan/tyrosine transport system substrate-binding protein
MSARVKRREFITLLGGAAVAWPLAAHGQQAGKVIRIGFIGASLNSSAMAAQYQAFLSELHELGFSEGRNIVIDYRRLDDPRGPFAVAAELMRLQVDLIVATGPEVALQAVVGASRSIPIVIMAVQYDPIERGYVSSLARPGGNITGVFYRQPELAAKQLELLTQTFPEKSRLAVLYDTNSADQFSAAEEAARSMPLELRPLKLEKPPYDFGAAFQTMAQGGAQMVLVLSSPFFVERRPEVAALAIEHRLPTMFVFKSYVEAGGLMSYGVEQLAMYRRIGLYVAKILNGTKPADLPVEQPTKFELIVNLKTAKAIGIELPTSILLRADEVIE